MGSPRFLHIRTKTAPWRPRQPNAANTLPRQWQRGLVPQLHPVHPTMSHHDRAQNGAIDLNAIVPAPAGCTAGQRRAFPRAVATPPPPAQPRPQKAEISAQGRPRDKGVVTKPGAYKWGCAARGDGTVTQDAATGDMCSRRYCCCCCWGPSARQRSTASHTTKLRLQAPPPAPPSAPLHAGRRGRALGAVGAHGHVVAPRLSGAVAAPATTCRPCAARPAPTGRPPSASSARTLSPHTTCMRARTCPPP